MKEGWKVLKFHETIIELQSKESWKMDLNCSPDYKLHGRLVGLNASWGLWKTPGMWIRMWQREPWFDHWALLSFPLCSCAHICVHVYTDVSVVVCVQVGELEWKHCLAFWLHYLTHLPPPNQGLGVVLRQLPLSCPCSLVWLEQTREPLFGSLRMKALFCYHLHQ